MRLANAAQYGEMVQLWERRIETLLRLRYQESGDTVLGNIERRLDLENVASFDRFAALSLQLEQQADSLSETQRRRLEAEREIALDRSYLLAQEALVRNAADVLTNIENHIAASGATSKTLGEHFRRVHQVEKELNNLADELAARMEVYEKQRYLLRQRLNGAGKDREAVGVEAGMVDNLLAELKQLQSDLEQQQKRADNFAQRLNARFAEVRRKELFERRPFLRGSEYRSTLTADLARVPALLFYQVQVSITAVFNLTMSH